MAPKPYDLLGLYARYGRERKVSLTTPESATAFLKELRGQLHAALNDASLLHGQRTAAMFEALVVALGRYKLIKVEDNGRLHPAGAYRAADFRVVLEDGEQWLVEVKNCFDPDPWGQRRQFMTPDYFASLDAYARATGASLKLAVFWARWGLWTVVSPAALLDEHGFLELGMTEALTANELSRLGDRMIRTRAPLKLRLIADPAKPNHVDANGLAHFTTRDLAFLSGDRVLTSPIEQEIAWVFMNFGEWIEQTPQAIVTDGRLDVVEFTWEPAEHRNDGFEMIGTLSRMFARHYREQTAADGEVTQIEAEMRPGWFAALTADHDECENLPLWRFEQVASQAK